MNFPSLRFSVLFIAVLLFGCEAGRTTGTHSNRGSGAGTEVLQDITGMETGAGNTALGTIIGNRIGGEPGEYIQNRMQEQVEMIREKLPEADVNQVSEGINLALDENDGEQFDEDLLKLTPRAKESLDKLATVFKQYNETKIVIEGHTDDQGNSGYNLTISRYFAESAADHLISKSIASNRITTRWYGEVQPKYDNNLKDGRAKKRRIEMAIVANDELKQKAREIAGNR